MVVIFQNNFRKVAETVASANQRLLHFCPGKLQADVSCLTVPLKGPSVPKAFSGLYQNVPEVQSGRPLHWPAGLCSKSSETLGPSAQFTPATRKLGEINTDEPWDSSLSRPFRRPCSAFFASTLATINSNTFHTANPDLIFILEEPFDWSPTRQASNQATKQVAAKRAFTSHHVHLGGAEPRLHSSQQQDSERFCLVIETAHQERQWEAKRRVCHIIHRPRLGKHSNHGAPSIFQEVCCCRRWRMWKDVSFDQLQPGRISRGMLHQYRPCIFCD